MPPLNIVADRSSQPCKICGASSPLFGVVDFNKNCLEQLGVKLDISGIPIYYRRCPECSFVFTDAFDDWTSEDFQQHIYNADYEKIDPEYTGTRAFRNAESIDKLFAANKAAMRMIDYGGGNGQLAGLLIEKGYSAESYDPFSQHNSRPSVRANFITCFEVIEHTNRPLEMLDDLLSLLEPAGVIVFSTAIQPDNFDAIGLSWWYVAPRNGHISIHSANSLIRLFASRQLDLHVVADGLVLAVPKSMQARLEIAKAV